MTKEIGSEFYNDITLKRDQVYLLSGRTALEFIIRDIKKNHEIVSALLPSYCCHTMIEPFFRHNITVRFYDVFFDKNRGLCVDIPDIKKNEIFYYMTYFGFSQIFGIDLERIRKQSAVIIEDKTHSWLCKESKCDADYTYTSYRKWARFDAIALATKEKGVFSDFPLEFNHKYCEMRKQAADLKQNFIEFSKGNKQRFLDLFGEAEELLGSDYVGYKPMSETMAKFLCWDTVSVSERRRKNAQILIDGLKDLPDVQLMYNSVEDGTVPLFVPILIEKQRKALIKFLIDNAVYCPVHWPKSSFHNGISKRADMLYNQELSLICDQRYKEEEMKHIVELIRMYYMR